MDKNELVLLVNYITNQGVKAIKDNTEIADFFIDYLAIFAKDESEYKKLVEIVSDLGEETNLVSAKTGQTFLLKNPVKTSAGELKYLKIRKPDSTRPQRGAPDFRVKDYNHFKEEYLKSSGNFTLMVRNDFEMIELKGVDVLVYFPDKLSGERAQ